MAYTSVASFSWTEQGDNWTADFEVNGASSASNTVPILHPMVRRVGKEKMNPFNPIVPTRLETPVYDEGRTLWDYIDSNKNDDIAIVVKKNGTIWHTGTLDRVQGGDRLRRQNPKLNLVWDNGLPVLKGKSFDEQERANLLESLWYILDSTPDNFDTRAALAFRNSNATSGLYSQATGLSLSRMGKGADYWEVLSQVLRKLNMQIWQHGSNERWMAVQRSYRDGSYDWEQRASGGTETNGSTDPTVTLTDSDFAGNPSENEYITRDKVPPSSWEEQYSFEWRSWLNYDFTSDVTEPISGFTVPEGWHLNGSMSFEPANDRLSMQATASGHAEQVWDEIVIKTNGDGIDQFDVQLTGEIEMTEGTGSSTIGVPVAKVTAHSSNATEYMDEGKLWSTTEQYVEAQVAEYTGTGSTFRSFDISLTSTALDLSGPDDAEVYIRVRLTTTTADPDSDGEDEVGEIRWDTCNVGGLARNVPREREPMGSASSKVEIGTSDQRESTGIGGTWLNIDTPASANQDAENPAAGIRYLDPTSGDLYLPEDSTWDHATRSYSGYLENVRLLDRYAQHSQELLRVKALVKADAVDFGDTVSWRSRTWVPVMIREVPKKKYKEIVLVELRDDDVSGADVEVTNGAFSSASTGGTAGGGGGGGGGGSAVSSVQTRTGAVEWASEDVGTGLTVDTTTDPNQIGVVDGGIDTTQLAADAVTEDEISATDTPSSGEFLKYNGSALEWDNNPSNVAADIDGDGTDEITDLSDITVQGDTNSIFTNPSAGELQISVGNKWPNADQVDGYEGSALAALAEDETVTGQWTFDQSLNVGKIQSPNDPTQQFLNFGIDGTLEGDRTFTFVLDDDDSRATNNVNWTFKAGGSEILQIGEDGTVGHPSFTSGWSGTNYQITEAGAAELDSLFLRGSLTVNELIVNRIHAVDGTQIIGPGRGRAASVSGSAPTETVDLEDPNGSGVTSFTAGDLILIQTVDVDQSTVVKRIVREVDSVDNTNAQVTMRDHSAGPSDTGSIEEGDTIVVIGHISDTSRQNVLVATATGSGAGTSPYRRTISGVASWNDWQDSSKVKTQTGNLSGLPNLSDGTSPSGYGFYGDNVFLEGTIVAGSGEIAAWTLDSEKLSRSNPDINIGTNLDASLTSDSVQLGEFNKSSFFESGLMVRAQSLDYLAEVGLRPVGSGGEKPSIRVNDKNGGEVNMGLWDRTGAEHFGLRVLAANGDNVFEVNETGTATIGNLTVTNALTIDGTGALTMDTPNGVDAIDIDQSTSFSALPSRNTSANDTTSTSGDGGASKTGLSTGTQVKPHKAEVDISHDSTSTESIQVSVEGSSFIDEIRDVDVPSSTTVTVEIDFNPATDSSVNVVASWNGGTTGVQVTINEVQIRYWDAFFEFNALGFQHAVAGNTADKAYVRFKDRMLRVAGGIEVDEEGEIFAENGTLKWRDYSDDSVTAIS